MKLPIDTRGITFACGIPKPIIDFETRAQKLDKNGVPLWQVMLFTASEDNDDKLKVKVAGEPKGLTPLCLVKVTNLVSSTWDMNGQTGVSYTADAIEPLKASA